MLFRVTYVLSVWDLHVMGDGGGMCCTLVSVHVQVHDRISSVC